MRIARGWLRFHRCLDEPRKTRIFEHKMQDFEKTSEENITLFLNRGHLAHNTWRSHRSLIRRFVAYWFARRQITRIPEADQKPNIGSRFFPYVYSKADIARLLAAAPSCQLRRR